MKTKIVGILVCTLLIATALPAVGTIIEKESPTSFGICSNSLDQQITKQTTMTDDRGGLFRQLPAYPGSPGPRPIPYAFTSADNIIVYDDFNGITSQISNIQWWGQTLLWENSKWELGNPADMIFEITFYEDNNSQPGAEICSYDEVIPEYSETGILYDYTEVAGYELIVELYYFKVQLEPSCNVSDGWMSIKSKYSPDDYWFLWMESLDGNSNSYQYRPPLTQLDTDLAFILSHNEPNLELSVKGGLGAKIEITNSGDETLNDIPVEIVIFGGMLGNISVQIEETISSLEPDETTSVKTGLFLGLGKIAIGVIVDDVVEYHSGFQLFIFTIIQ